MRKVNMIWHSTSNRVRLGNLAIAYKNSHKPYEISCIRQVSAVYDFIGVSSMRCALAVMSSITCMFGQHMFRCWLQQPGFCLVAPSCWMTDNEFRDVQKTIVCLCGSFHVCTGYFLRPKFESGNLWRKYPATRTTGEYHKDIATW